MKRKLFFSLVWVMLASSGFMCGKVSAQVDPHFSQYYAYPLWLNPGLTGVMDGDFRVTANYKKQWATISNPYSTMALSFDSYPFKNLGMGGTIINQSAGDGGYRYLNALFSAAYNARLDTRQMNVISIGLQAGIVNRRFDPTKLQSGSQWRPITGFDPTAPSGEIYDVTSSLGFDANAGIVYYNQNPNTSLNPFGGVSLYHLSRPHSAFFKESTERIPLRFNVHGGMRMKMTSNFYLTPQFIYLQQGNAHETVISLYGQALLKKYSAFLFGATYRVEDALTPFVGFHLGDFTLGLSYDINISRLEVASLNQGGLELSLTFIKHKKIRDHQFICPRL